MSLREGRGGGRRGRPLRGKNYCIGTLYLFCCHFWIYFTLDNLLTNGQITLKFVVWYFYWCQYMALLVQKFGSYIFFCETTKKIPATSPNSTLMKKCAEKSFYFSGFMENNIAGLLVNEIWCLGALNWSK